MQHKAKLLIALPDQYRRLFASLLLITLTLWSAGCGTPQADSPESAVRRTLENLEAAAERRSLTDFMQHISRDYQDHRGDQWADIQRLVQFQYIRHQSIHIYSDISELTIDGDIATAEVKVAMAARAQELDSAPARLRADTHQFSVLLRDAGDNNWLVESVAWQRGWR